MGACKSAHKITDVHDKNYLNFLIVVIIIGYTTEIQVKNYEALDVIGKQSKCILSWKNKLSRLWNML